MVRTKPKPPTPTHVFRAVWPVVSTGHPIADLLDEALEDLPNVARRHNAVIVGKAQAGLMDGRRVPGSGGAAQVLVIEAPAIHKPARSYRHG